MSQTIFAYSFQNILCIFFILKKKIAFLSGGGSTPPPPPLADASTKNVILIFDVLPKCLVKLISSDCKSDTNGLSQGFFRCMFFVGPFRNGVR